MSRLRTSDLDALLSFLGQAQSIDGPDPFDVALLDRAATLVPCDLVTFNVLDRARRLVVSYRSSLADDVLNGLSDDAWDALDAHPVIVHRLRMADVDSVLTLSDFFGRRARLRHEVHPEYSRDPGIVDEAWLYLGRSLTHMVAVGFQSCGRDLSERDRNVLEVLRPHLIALDANARTRQRLAVLLEALARSEADEPDGVILLGRRREVDHASRAARRLVGRWFGELSQHLPGELEDWLASTAKPPPLWIERGDRRLVVEAPDGTALLLREEIVSEVALTVRERDVLRCIAAGRSTAETARLLWITPATVSKHLEHVYVKLGVHSRTAALAVLGMRAEPLHAEISG